jgi:D-alanyl-D-alanine carboxypeptidase
MKKAVSAVLSVIILVVVSINTAFCVEYTAKAELPAVSAQACVLYCVENGKLYYSKNEHKKIC